MFERFSNRAEAGRRLAERLARYASTEDLLVLALPRGGVPVGFEVARALKAPLDVFIVRKLGVPGHEELAMGAIASGGDVILNEEIVTALDISGEAIERVRAAESAEVGRRERLYHGNVPNAELGGRTVILVDDGLATGATMKAAVTAVRRSRPRAVVVAVPVCAHPTCTALRGVADDVVCVETPEPFHAVGIWYRDFTQTTDDEVRQLLVVSRPPPSGAPSASKARSHERRGRLGRTAHALFEQPADHARKVANPCRLRHDCIDATFRSERRTAP
ncbi:MAG: phosphoribosyltransferase [Polyangiaceae bacterium]|nr:phosphoribosyltransferase [Polyangiaceae bacterium]